MKAPVRARAERQEKFEVNGDPAKLDAMYARFLGRSGPKMLSDETKWLAVTHKSFDHARRGFNDRMAFLGRQIVELQTSLGLLNNVDANGYMSNSQDAYGRQPFHHPSIENVEVLNGGGKQFFLHHKQISGVAARYGLPEVVRWQPKDVHDLPGSGCDMVYAQALYAIVGALALEQGGQVANKIARERILQPVGLRTGSLEGSPAEQAISS
ncbi:hypothetical protein PMZ80_010511 [Knufia obscura]|uniref:RNase III domain-containing protein n=1 Tax=Knufia obscura TaxID=1635080 RepID=A0ABR0R998_9EURO|nr:hypothetical protein PMZ80_010511 [Knufia obscura]